VRFDGYTGRGQAQFPSGEVGFWDGKGEVELPGTAVWWDVIERSHPS
jgi:hypothetical protein